jgi:hypothetical protein
VKKSAISVTTNVEPETQFLAGIPASPTAAIARTEILASPRRTPKTMALKTEGGIPSAISEGFRETADRLSRKFGSFWAGFLCELKAAQAR